MAKIGKRVNAKKYKELRELQTKVNKMLYASDHIEKTNGKRQQVLAMKRQFYKSRGIKNPSKLSFKNLSPKDIKAYTNMLESIANNTFINPEKYKQYQDKMREKFDSYGYDFEYEEIKDVLESDIVQELINEGLSPSEFWQVYAEITSDYGNIDIHNFYDMAREFLQEVRYGDMSINEFFVFADEYFSILNDPDATRFTDEEFNGGIYD